MFGLLRAVIESSSWLSFVEYRPSRSIRILSVLPDEFRVVCRQAGSKGNPDRGDAASVRFLTFGVVTPFGRGPRSCSGASLKALIPHGVVLPSRR